MTWLQLWKRIGKQPLYATRNKEVKVKLQDIEYSCKLVYTDNGSDWHLEPEYAVQTIDIHE